MALCYRVSPPARAAGLKLFVHSLWAACGKVRLQIADRFDPVIRSRPIGDSLPAFAQGADPRGKESRNQGSDPKTQAASSPFGAAPLGIGLWETCWRPLSPDVPGPNSIESPF
jgi:hypothetical protein